MALKRENNFDLSGLAGNWYTNAAGMEFRTVWGGPKIWDGEIGHIEWMRAQTCWMEGELDDLAVRRRAVIEFAKAIFSPAAANEIESKAWNLIPTETNSPRLASAICTLYNDPPVRTFSDVAEVNESFNDLYADFDVDLAMQEAYRSALFTNTVVIMPQWDGRTVRVLTPDYFRIVQDEYGNLEQLWLPHGSGGYDNTLFEVWTADEHKWLDHAGHPAKNKPSETNPYGRIPAVLMRLNRTNGVYGAGISEAADLNALLNFIRFLGTNIAVFQSFSVALATNMGSDFKPGVRIGPGQVLHATNVVGEAGTNPSLQYITPDGKFIDLEAYRQKILRTFQRNYGLPAFLLDEGAGQPPTGAALQVMERDLNIMRKQHAKALTRAERDLAELMALMGSKSAAGNQLAWPDVRRADKFTIQYAEPETFSDPNIELDFDLKKAQNGFMTPSELLAKYSGAQQGISEDDAAKQINDTKKYFQTASELRSTVGGATALQALIIAYESGQVSQQAAISAAILVYGFQQPDAEKMFIAKSVTPSPSPTPGNLTA